MSKTRQNALRPLIDAHTADYVDAVLAQQKAEHDAFTQALSDRLARLADNLARVENEVMAMQQTRLTSADRYDLTRAKVLAVLKDLGVMK